MQEDKEVSDRCRRTKRSVTGAGGQRGQSQGQEDKEVSHRGRRRVVHWSGQAAGVLASRTDQADVLFDVLTAALGQLTFSADLFIVGFDQLTVLFYGLTVVLDMLTVGLDMLTVGMDMLTVGLTCSLLGWTYSLLGWTYSLLG